MEAKGHLDDTHLADHPRTDQFDEFGGLWMTAVHKGFHQEDIVPECGLDDSHRLCVVERKRLFAQDMLSRFGSLDRPFRV